MSGFGGRRQETRACNCDMLPFFEISISHFSVTFPQEGGNGKLNLSQVHEMSISSFEVKIANIWIISLHCRYAPCLWMGAFAHSFILRLGVQQKNPNGFKMFEIIRSSSHASVIYRYDYNP